MAEDKDIEGYTKGVDADREEVLSKVLQEHHVFQTQREKRKELIRKLERYDKDKKVGVVAFICSDRSSIDSEDIPALGDALLSIGDVDRLDLILDGPGGDGTIAEKIIELCRSYCKRFRVIVPNRAKSAATIIALGADQIVMGHCSELGPIDAQVPVVVGGIPRYISAQSFIDARVNLEKDFKETIAKGEDPRHILQQIASLDPPFVDHCEKLMEFSKEVAKDSLGKYMFKSLSARERSQRIAKVLKRLSSVDIFKVHGRMINGTTAKTDLKLEVKLIAKNDPFWKDIWHYYVRAVVMMNQPAETGKLVETRSEVLIMQSSRVPS